MIPVIYHSGQCIKSTTSCQQIYFPFAVPLILLLRPPYAVARRKSTRRECSIFTSVEGAYGARMRSYASLRVTHTKTFISRRKILHRPFAARWSSSFIPFLYCSRSELNNAMDVLHPKHFIPWK